MTVACLGEKNRFLTGLGVGENYAIFLAGSIFKIGSLNLFSTEPTFRYRELLKFRDLIL